MQERLQKAVRRVFFLKRDQGYSIPYAIGIVSRETGIPKKEISRALHARGQQKKDIADIKRTLKHADSKEKGLRGYAKGAKEKCRECGHELSYMQDKCPLCGVDTGWIFGIAENIDEI